MKSLAESCYKNRCTVDHNYLIPKVVAPLKKKNPSKGPKPLCLGMLDLILMVSVQSNQNFQFMNN